jgi:hypothetical protein
MRETHDAETPATVTLVALLGSDRRGMAFLVGNEESLDSTQDTATCS